MLQEEQRGLSLSRSRVLLMTVSPTKAAEPIVMPLGMVTRVGPRNSVSDGGPGPHA